MLCSEGKLCGSIWRGLPGPAPPPPPPPEVKNLAFILQRKLTEDRTEEARYCGSAAEKGSGKAVQRPLAPTSPHSIRRSRPPEVTGGWRQTIAEELLIDECQWSREAELNGRLREQLGHTGPWAPDAPPGSSRRAGRTPGGAFRSCGHLSAGATSPEHGAPRWGYCRGQLLSPSWDRWFLVTHTGQTHTHTRVPSAQPAFGRFGSLRRLCAARHWERVKVDSPTLPSCSPASLCKLAPLRIPLLLPFREVASAGRDP